MTGHWAQCASAVAVGVAACPISGEVRAQSQAQAYATSGPWQIEFVPADRHRQMAAHCRATKTFGTENALRLVIGDGLSTIDFMGFGSHALGRTLDVTYVFDNDASYVTKHTANMVADNDGIEWMRIDGPGSYDAQKNTKVLTIRAAKGNGRREYQLAGSNLALDAVGKCVEERVRGGKPQGAAPVAQGLPRPPAQARPAPMAQMQPPALPTGGIQRASADIETERTCRPKRSQSVEETRQ